MATEIKRTPVVTGSSAEKLAKQIEENEKNRGSIDFSKQIEIAKKILSEAKL
jgi:hypothetical protein